MFLLLHQAIICLVLLVLKSEGITVGRDDGVTLSQTRKAQSILGSGIDIYQLCVTLVLDSILHLASGGLVQTRVLPVASQLASFLTSGCFLNYVDIVKMTLKGLLVGIR